MHVTKILFIDVCRNLAIRSALLFCLWVAFTLGTAEAAIFACPTATGEIAYQDRPCVKQAQTVVPSTTDDAKDTGSAYPLGIHPSWFIPPTYAPQPAYCDRLGCECATMARNFHRGLEAAVADALFLEATWHRYAEQVIRMETDPPIGLARLELQAELSDSACEIQMSQLTLKNYASQAVNNIERNAELAERRGHTDYDQCDGSNELVCADVEAYSLNERVQLDLRTLRTPRNIFVADIE